MYRKILVVVADSSEAQIAVKQGIELASVHGADIFFFYVLPRFDFELFTLDVPSPSTVSPAEFQMQVRKEASDLLAAAILSAETEGVHSFKAMGSGPNDAACVADAARTHKCDLIVVGTESQNAVMRLLTGSIVPGLITLASTPVLVCREANSPTRSSRRVQKSVARVKRR